MTLSDTKARRRDQLRRGLNEFGYWMVRIGIVLMLAGIGWFLFAVAPFFVGNEIGYGWLLGLALIAIGAFIMWGGARIGDVANSAWMLLLR